MAESRQKRVARVTEQTFAALLSGSVRCVNWPAGSAVRRIMFEPQFDSWLVQIENAQQFDAIPEGNPFPEFELLFEKVYI